MMVPMVRGSVGGSILGGLQRIMVFSLKHGALHVSLQRYLGEGLVLGSLLHSDQGRRRRRTTECVDLPAEMMIIRRILMAFQVESHLTRPPLAEVRLNCF